MNPFSNQKRPYTSSDIRNDTEPPTRGITLCQECTAAFLLDIICLRCRRIFCQHTYTADHICEHLPFENQTNGE